MIIKIFSNLSEFMMVTLLFSGSNCMTRSTANRFEPWMKKPWNPCLQPGLLLSGISLGILCKIIASDICWINMDCAKVVYYYLGLMGSICVQAVRSLTLKSRKRQTLCSCPVLPLQLTFLHLENKGHNLSWESIYFILYTRNFAVSWSFSVIPFWKHRLCRFLPI